MSGKVWPVALTAVGACNGGALTWRLAGQLHLTIVVKATFTLVPDGDMALAEPEPLATREAYRDGGGASSLQAAGDLAPYLAQTDLLLSGHARAPKGRPVPQVRVRFGVFRGAAVLDKALAALGPDGGRVPFEQLPLAYEHAVGSREENPVGVADPAKARIVGAIDPRAPVGFGPLSRRWPVRARRLGRADASAVEAPVPDLPAGFDWTYFQAAPVDQRVPHLAGDEWIVLEGLHADKPQIRTRLPSARGVAIVYGLTPGAPEVPRPCALAADTLHVDADSLRASVVFRASFPVADVMQLAAMHVDVGVDVAGKPVAWPPPPEPTPASVRARSRATQELPAYTEESTLVTATFAAPSAKPVLPFRPGAPAVDPSRARVLHPLVEPATNVPAHVDVPALTIGQMAARGDLAPPTAHSPRLVEVQRGAPPPRAPSGAASLHARALPPAVVARPSGSIPFVGDSSFVGFTIPWQIKPPQETRAVVVKGTFALVEGGPAARCEETEPPSGDVHADDDPARSVVYPSDFVVFKPRVDVTLSGHAYAPGGSSQAALVRFRFGRGARGFDRQIAVFGDRRWESSVVRTGPSDAQRFEKLPLCYELAFGGPGSRDNPIGRGHGGALRLPNLEDPTHLVRSPSDSPEPVGFGAKPMRWATRWSKLGTYGPEWLKSRWPYFPDDFDWSFFQHAPSAQQLEGVELGAAYEVVGMHKGRPSFAGTLPRERPRCFARTIADAGGALTEVAMRLDTVTFDVDASKLTLVWRGLLDVRDDQANEIEDIFLLGEDGAGADLTQAEVEARYASVKQPLQLVGDDPNGSANEAAPASVLSPAEQRLRERLRVAGVLEAAPGPAAATAMAIFTTSVRRPDLRARVVDRLARGDSFEGADLAGADLSGLDLTGRSLAGAILKDALIAGCNLSGADLSGAQLSNADASGARFAGARLVAADLGNATLTDAVFDGADLRDANLAGARGERASFRDARGDKATFAQGTWTSARFDKLTAAGADFSASLLDGAVFDGATLSEVRLYDARGAKTSFRDAALTGARADGVALLQSSLKGAQAAGSVWDGASLDDTTFVGATLRDASFEKASAPRAVFSGADLVDARLPRANLTGAVFLTANLMQASFDGADLSGADLRASNLHGAATWKAKLRGADLGRAIVTQTRLKGKA